MRQLLKTFGLCLLLLACLPASAKKENTKKNKTETQQSEPTLEELADKVVDLEEEISELEKKRDALMVELDQKTDSLIRAKETLIETLNREKDEALKGNGSLQKAKENEIIEWENRMVKLATNFLFVPYDKKSIDKIAIPAFNDIKGSDVYNQYKIRLTLLQNYETDAKELIAFCSKHEKDMVNPLRSDEWKQKTLAELKALPCVIEYQQYGKGWENSTLGKVIVILSNAINSFSASNRDAFKAIFKHESDKLDQMLNEGNK